MIETQGMRECQCYRTTLVLKGSHCEKVQIAICVGGKVPAISRHDISKLRTWVRTRCFGGHGPDYIAPPAMVGHGCHSCE